MKNQEEIQKKEELLQKQREEKQKKGKGKYLDLDWLDEYWLNFAVSPKTFEKRLKYRDRLFVFDASGEETVLFRPIARSIRKEMAICFFEFDQSYDIFEINDFLFAHMPEEFQERWETKYLESTLHPGFKKQFEKWLLNEEERVLKEVVKNKFRVLKVTVPKKTEMSYRFDITLTMGAEQKTFECRYFNPDSYVFHIKGAADAMQFMRPYQESTIFDYFEGWNAIKNNLLLKENTSLPELDHKMLKKVFFDMIKSAWQKDKEFQLKKIADGALKTIDFRII